MLKCLNCGKAAVLVDDSELEEMPPTLSARLLYCAACDIKEFVEADELGYEDWTELEQARA